MPPIQSDKKFVWSPGCLYFADKNKSCRAQLDHRCRIIFEMSLSVRPHQDDVQEEWQGTRKQLSGHNDILF